MTHEPDIIREAERIVKAMHEFRDATSVTVEQAACNIRTALRGLDSPEPTVRVAADEQRDYGDEHKERA